MRLAVIGVGQAGGRVADLLTNFSIWSGYKIVPMSLAVNTAKSDLMGLKTIPMKNRVLVGKTRVKGHGVGLDSELGSKIFKDDIHSIRRALAEGEVHHSIDAFMVIAGLGGGTGSGGAPVIARDLKEFYDEPVYATGILPTDDEGMIMVKNAVKSLQGLSETVDSVILFDNNMWKREGLPILESYNYMNYELTKPLKILLETGEVTSQERVGVKVIDASDVIRTLHEFTVAGHSDIRKPLGERLKDSVNHLFIEKTSIDELDPALKCFSAVRTAAMRLTADCSLKDVRKALMIIAGPPGDLNREGIEKGKGWLEQITGGEVRGGDYPTPRSTKLSGTVLFSGLRSPPRIKALMDKVTEEQRIRESIAN